MFRYKITFPRSNKMSCSVELLRIPSSFFFILSDKICKFASQFYRYSFVYVFARYRARHVRLPSIYFSHMPYLYVCLLFFFLVYFSAWDIKTRSYYPAQFRSLYNKNVARTLLYFTIFQLIFVVYFYTRVYRVYTLMNRPLMTTYARINHCRLR